MTATEDIIALEARMKAERFEQLYAEMQGAGQGSSFDAEPPSPSNHLTAEDLRKLQAERRWFVRRHHVGLHDEERQLGCPYCYAPGPNGDYQP